MSAVCTLCGGTIRAPLRWVRDTWEGDVGYVAFATGSYAASGAVARDGRTFTAYDERHKLLGQYGTLRDAKAKVAHLAHNLAAMRADTKRRNAQ